jgi:hypothetical protein
MADPSDFFSKRNDLKDYNDVFADMHRIMVPLLGLLFAFFAIAVVIFLAIKPRFVTFLRYFLALLLIYQIFASLFVWFSTVWEIGFQFFAFALFGIWALFTKDSHKRHILIFTIMALFDFFVVMGKVSILGYNIKSIDALDNAACSGYYAIDADEAQCTGFLNFLRFLVYLITLGQPLQVFFGYLLYHNYEAHGEHGEPNEYGKIGDAVSAAAQ